MTALANLIARRTQLRRVACEHSARAVREALRSAGATVRIVGSVEAGRVHEHSDLDVLVVDRGPLREGELLALAERHSTVPVDLIFDDELAPHARARIERET